MNAKNERPDVTGNIGPAQGVPTGVTGSDHTTPGARGQSSLAAFVAQRTADAATFTPAQAHNEPEYLQDAPSKARRKGGIKQPHDLLKPEMEQALCASAVQDSAVFTLDVQPGDFHDERLQAIWRTGQELVRSGAACDAIILGDAVETHHPGLVSVAYMVHLQAMDVTPAIADSYAAIVCDAALQRRAWELVQAGGRAIFGGNGTWKGDLARVAGDMTRIITPAKATAQAQRVTGWTAAELLAANFPEPVWAVPDIIPVGLTFLAGRPKVGKSWFALQVAIAAGSGGMVLDKRVRQGRVIYLALEDNGRRLKERIKKQGIPSGATIRFETSWPRLTEGGLDLLTQAIESEGYTLAIVDTLGRFVGRADTNDYGDMTSVVGALQEAAISRDMAVLVVDHHRKGAPGVEDDPIDAIVGSTGKSGAADAVLGLTKQQGKKGARLRVTGRDLEELDMVLSWDAALCCWQYDGTTEEVELQGRRGLVLAVLQEAHPEPMTAGEIAKAAMMHREKVIPLLNDLVTSGHVTKEPKQGKEQPYRAAQGKAQ